MSEIKKIFDEISSEPGSNKKMEILSSYKDNELLKRVLYLANSPRIKFYIKQIPEYTPDNSSPEKLKWGLDGLKLLSSRKFTGHEATKWLQVILSGLSKDDAYIIERIIDKDCRIGMADNNINKVFKKLIEQTPYMGAKAFEENLARKIFENRRQGYSQIKMDGRYCNAIIRNGVVDLESRQGEATILEGATFLEELKQWQDCVLNGELTIDGIPDRAIANGIVTSLISIGKKKIDGEDIKKELEKFEKKNKMSFEEALKLVKFTVWDKITVEEYENAYSDRTYDYRFGELAGILLGVHKPKMIALIEHKLVSSYEEAMEHFLSALSRGLEGTILKACSTKWEDGKHNNQIKMKLEMDVDLKIVGFNYGTGKNEKVISSLNAESSDGRVFTRPTGIDEETMKFITDNQDKLLGTIVEVKSCGLTKDSEGNYALLHPVFKKLRDDKNTCDSFDSIQKIEAMAKGLVPN